MFLVWQKFREFRLALEAGDYRKAARLVIEVLDLLIPEEGTENALREPAGASPDAFTEEGFAADAKAVKAALATVKKPRKVKGAVGADAAGSGGVWVILAIELLTKFGPLLIDLIKRRQKEQQGQ